MSHLVNQFSKAIILILILITGTCTLPIHSNAGESAQEDLSGGVGVFITRADNPPVYQRIRRRTVSPVDKPNSSSPNAIIVESSEGEPLDMIEEALALGNSARDVEPPRYQDAERAYKLAAKLQPKDPRPHIGLGNILSDQKRYAEAVSAYKDALDLANMKVESRAEKSDKRNSKGTYKTGGNRSMKANPRPPYERFILSEKKGQIHAYLGNSLLRKGDLVNAESEFKKAIAKDGSNAQWYALLGYALFSQRKYVGAVDSYKMATQLEPTNTKYKDLLEEALSKQRIEQLR